MANKKTQDKVTLSKGQLTRLINRGVSKALTEILPNMAVNVYHNSSVDIKATTSGAYEGSFKVYAGTSKAELDLIYSMARDQAYAFRSECPTTSEAKNGVVKKKVAIKEYRVHEPNEVENPERV